MTRPHLHRRLTRQALNGISLLGCSVLSLSFLLNSEPNWRRQSASLDFSNIEEGLQHYVSATGWRKLKELQVQVKQANERQVCVPASSSA